MPQTNIRLDDATLDGLKEIKARLGIPVAEQIRRALQRWLDENRPKGKGKEGHKGK